ncbi:hypothetical protein UFOVP543_27 [uncultured Caudovirales phage]|uniref:Uncharacterized protein n=1 Tax=uncultured Caudovirales phage TaxID=2100421 RepID=A0A6J5P1R2_9CAUD|nr:hypothetical protein UFOVP543_27 [uncultured Caudovirales phage]CAB4163231.1 hypothetical protein UFOVP804_3 [uncultured Caudovirales phage]
MCSGGGSDSYARQSREDEMARQERIKTGTADVNKKFEGFNDSFYGQRQQDYKNYAEPQLREQLKGENSNLAYNLARSGMTDSSERSRNEGELQRQFSQGKADIASAALDQSNQARQRTEQNRSELLGQLNATGDAASVGSQAINRAGMLSSQQAFSPLGHMFTATTGLLGNAATAGYYDRNAPGINAYKNLFGGGSGGSSGSSRTVKTN